MKHDTMTTITDDNKEQSIAELLAMPDGVDIDFEPPRLTTLYHPAFFDQLRLNDDVHGDDLTLLFEREKDTGRDTIDFDGF